MKLMRPDPGMKQCGKCGIEKPMNADHFDKDSSKYSGFKTWCKACRAEKKQALKLEGVAAVLQSMDQSVVKSLAESAAGGTNIPHAAEIYQHIMAHLGGVQGFAMHFAGNIIAAQPGGQIRERMLTNLMKLGQAVSDDNKVAMPFELMSTEDLNKELERREGNMRIVNLIDAKDSVDAKAG